MFKEIMSAVGNLLWRACRWYLRKSVIGWRYELRRLRTGENRGLKVIPNLALYTLLCILMSVVLLWILAGMAFANNWSLGLSFIFSGILAISFGYILRNPMFLIVVYVLLIFRREVTALFSTAENTALSGDILGAVIVIGLIIYLLMYAKRIESSL